jgi:acid phosphatase type 7
VDLVFLGHVHNYERACAVYKRKCKGMPKKDAGGIDTYDNSNYTAPVHVIAGAGGFSLDNFPKIIIVRVTQLSLHCFPKKYELS